MNRNMKTSSEPWIGLVPSDWDESKIKYVAPIHNERAESNEGYIGLENIEGWTGKLLPSDSTATGESISFLKDDVLFGKLRPYLAKSVVAHENGCGSTELLVMRPENINPNYLGYICRSKTFVDCIDVSTYGAKMPRANGAFIGNLHIPMPSEIEQRTIVSYLDARCSAIDEAIERHKKIIEKLEEYRSAKIDELTTRGYDRAVEMKESGIRSIGIIPNHWSVTRIKHVASLHGRIGFRGYTQNDLVLEGEGPITLSPSNLVNGTMSYDKLSYLTWEKYNESPEIQVSNGDILMVKTGSSYGKVSYVDKLPMEATINPQLVVLKSTDSLKYLSYCLQTTNLRYCVENIVVGGTIPTMSQEKISNIHIPCPPKEEQEHIVLMLDEICDNITNATNRHYEAIKKLEEYRKSIIYNAVTGKIDCREAVK